MNEHTIKGIVASLDQLRGDDGEFLAGIVHVTGCVALPDKQLYRLPVQFGTVGDSFFCHQNLLTTLEGAPTSVGGTFWCMQNLLTTLEGAPTSVGGTFHCGDNQLTSLVGVHRHLKRIDSTLVIPCTIESGGIGLILVEGLEFIGTHAGAVQPAFKIINRYLGQGMKGVLRCQEELHDAGLEEFARL